MIVTEDVRLEAGARALCALRGINPDEPALKDGKVVPLWHLDVPAAQAVLTAADTVDLATPEMEQAGIDAMESGSQDASSLIQKIWTAMAALRPGSH